MRSSNHLNDSGLHKWETWQNLSSTMMLTQEVLHSNLGLDAQSVLQNHANSILKCPFQDENLSQLPTLSYICIP